MFVCPVPKISQVMMKWRRRASHHGRFTLWHNGRRATRLGRFTLSHNGRRVHNSVDLLCGTTDADLHNSVNLLCGTTAAELNQPGLMYAPGVAHIFQRQWRTMLKNMKAQSKVKFYSGCLTSANFWKMNALEDSEKHRLIVDLQQTLEICTLYFLFSKLLKDERFTKTE